jgi:CheY-like chemotaxis protein
LQREEVTDAGVAELPSWQQGFARMAHYNPLDRPYDLSGPVLLVVSADHATRQSSSAQLRSWSWSVLEAASVEEALQELRGSAPDAVIADVHLPDTASGFRLAQVARTLCPGTVILLCAGSRHLRRVVDRLLEDYIEAYTR